MMALRDCALSGNITVDINGARGVKVLIDLHAVDHQQRLDVYIISGEIFP